MRIVFEELSNETSRDQWIAVSAAMRIAAGERVSSIETEPLEALSDWIRAELQDRDLRDPCTLNLF